MDKQIMVTLVTTVYNDRQGTKLFLARLAQQTQPPDEVIIVDSYSKDGTWELLLAEVRDNKHPWVLRAIQEKCNVAKGRNTAIRHSSGEIIVSTDIGCDWDPDWLESLVSPLANSSTQLCIGSWKVREDTLESIWAKVDYCVKNRHLFIATPDSQSSSRSIAFRREVWSLLGGYPEDLTLAADDTVFDLFRKAHRIPTAASERIACYWHRHSTLGGLLKENYRYLYGNGEALITVRHFILSGGTLTIELVLLILGASLWFYTDNTLWAALACLLFLSIPMSRARRWTRTNALLKGTFSEQSLLRIMAYDYLLRATGFYGYARGFLHGFRHCSSCRARVRQANAFLRGAPLP